MSGLIKPKVAKKKHFIDESIKTVTTTLTNLHNIFSKSYWPEIYQNIVPCF